MSPFFGRRKQAEMSYNQLFFFLNITVYHHINIHYIVHEHGLVYAFEPE